MARVKMTLERLASLIVEGFETLNGKVDAITEDLTRVKRDVGEIKDDVGAHGRAIDKDAVTLIDHERRITKLEHVR